MNKCNEQNCELLQDSMGFESVTSKIPMKSTNLPLLCQLLVTFKF